MSSVAQTRSRCIALPMLTSVLDENEWQSHDSAALPPGKGSGTVCTGGWVGWTGKENRKFLTTTGVQTLNLPARSSSLILSTTIVRPESMYDSSQRKTHDCRARILNRTDSKVNDVLPGITGLCNLFSPTVVWTSAVCGLMV